MKRGIKGNHRSRKFRSEGQEGRKVKTEASEIENRIIPGKRGTRKKLRALGRSKDYRERHFGKSKGRLKKQKSNK